MKTHIRILIVLVFLAYIPSLFCGFVWVDQSQVVEGQSIIHNLNELSNAFTSSTLITRKGYYRPTFNLSLTADHIIYGKRAWGFHFTNILLHIFNAILAFLILKKFVSEKHAFFISLLWAIHPIGVFAVTWISARADLLFSLFLLLSFYFYLKYKESDKTGHLLIFFSSFILGLMSKDVAYVYPLVILAYEIMLSKRKKWVVVLCTFLISFLCLLLKVSLTGKLGTKVPFLHGEPLTVFYTMSVVMLDYLRKIVFPLGLSASDAFLKFKVFHPAVLAALFTFGYLFYIAFKKSSKDKSIPFFLMWFFIFLVPASNIIPALHFRAERFLYLPLLGIIYFFIAPFGKEYQLKRLCIILAFLACITVLRQDDFRNDLTLFRRAIEMEPHTKEAHQMLGFYYLKRNDYNEAYRYYTRALKIDGEYFSFIDKFGVYHNLGVIYTVRNQIPAAIDYFKKALRIHDDALAHINLYFCFKDLGQPEEAGEHLDSARRLDPGLVNKHLGNEK